MGFLENDLWLVVFFFFNFLSLGQPCGFGASLVVQIIKNPPAIQETWVRSLGGEDPLKKGMATHYSILA